jgi:APA family basic amino acid/polyamine antiporter
MDLFRRKNVADLQAEAAKDQSLKRALGPVNLTSLGIGAIIGAGIFVLTGHAAAQYAGPAIVLSFILAGIACAFAGLCYAEFASMIPISGSAYTYGYATLGEFVAWIIGWDLILEYLFAASTVAVGWSGYVVSFLKDFGITIPAAFTSAPYNHVTPPDAQWWNLWQLFVHGWVSTGAVLNVPAMLIVGVVTIGELQQRHRRAETRGHSDLHRRRRRLHQQSQLASVRASCGCAWQFRLARRAARGGRDFFRLHRI